MTAPEPRASSAVASWTMAVVRSSASSPEAVPAVSSTAKSAGATEEVSRLSTSSSSSPASTEAVAEGSAVDLAVSLGARADSAPGVLGRPVDEAVRLLAEAGFAARVEESLGAPFGYVVAQTTDGAEVVLTVV